MIGNTRTIKYDYKKEMLLIEDKIREILKRSIM